MNRFVVVFCFLFASSCLAFDAQSIYSQKLTDKETGVYEESGHLFFVINQPCLTDKKYSGTKESKAAEKEFYALLVKTAKRYNLSFDKASIQFGGQLQTAIYDNVSLNDDVLSKITHRLIFDRDSKSKQCVREYVKVSPLDNFGQNKVKISALQAEKIAADLIYEAVIEKDYQRVADYTSEFNLPTLAKLYKVKSQGKNYPFNLAYGEHEKLNAESTIASFPPPPRLNKYDLNAVIATVLQEKGFLNIETYRPNIELSQDFFMLAKKDFDQGVNPDDIIKNLTLSINLNSQNSDAWERLSSIYRALQNNERALIVTRQYVIQSSEKIEPWVYLLKALQPVSPQEAKKLHALLSLMTNKTELTSWAQSQIKDYK